MEQLTIINKALLKCGLPLAAAIQDCDWNAAFIFQTCAEELLRQHPWNFARNIVSLAQSSSQTHGWLKTYLLPGDCLRVVDVHACSEMRGPKARYELVMGNLCCNVSPCYLRYVTSQTPVASYPADFADALAWRIACEIAALSTQSIGMIPQMTQAYELACEKAKAIDARENAERVPLDWNILLSRAGIGERRGR